jgi:hypothetical protein
MSASGVEAIGNRKGTERAVGIPNEYALGVFGADEKLVLRLTGSCIKARSNSAMTMIWHISCHLHD